MASSTRCVIRPDIDWRPSTTSNRRGLRSCERGRLFSCAKDWSINAIPLAPLSTSAVARNCPFSVCTEQERTRWLPLSLFSSVEQADIVSELSSSFRCPRPRLGPRTARFPLPLSHRHLSQELPCSRCSGVSLAIEASPSFADFRIH